MAPLPHLQRLIERTPFVDTHEHLLEERTRLAGAGAHRYQPCDDFALLFSQYARDDLASAGMPADALERFFATDVEPGEKWRLVEPHWRRCRHTGYLQALTLAIRLLFGEAGWSAAAAERVTERLRAQARPGFYRRLLDRAGIATCQVNSQEATLFCESQYPQFLQQDISLFPLVTYPALGFMREQSGLPVASLADWHRVIDWTFATYAGRAVAVKSPSAYVRRLDYADVPASAAAPLFARLLKSEKLAEAERKALDDHLMWQCARRAGEYRLPLKLHCGYLSGSGSMPLGRVRQNAVDLCPLLAAFPETTFVLMHIGYPYQDEYIALAKHYPNVYVDLCWAWILNPAACTRFVKEFLLGAPAGKLLTFGGDYGVIEPVVGHAALARQGLAQALSELVGDGWLAEDDALALVPELMHGNATRLFGRQAAPAAGTQAA